jgi:hypothetical protein
MAVHVLVILTSRHDCFIDDVIQIFLDTLFNRARMPSIVPLVIHVSCRPHDAGDDELVPRRPLLSPSKLEAEVDFKIVNSKNATVLLSTDAHCEPFVVERIGGLLADVGVGW